MAKKDMDQFYKELASRYAEMDGQKLKQELEDLEKSPEAINTTELDWKVKQKLYPPKSRRYMIRIAATVACAACLLLFLFRSDVMDFIFTNDSFDISNVDEDQTSAPVEQDIDDDAEDAEAADDGAAPAPQQEYEMIELAFELPVNLSVDSVKQDQGKTIYHLKNEDLDDVVLTLEEISDDTIPAAINQELEPIPIDQQTAYGMYHTDYSILMFEKDNLAYTLTCKYDINTLIQLSREII